MDSLFKPDGDGFFDVVLSWTTANNDDRFNAGEIFMMDITCRATVRVARAGMRDMAGPGGT